MRSIIYTLLFNLTLCFFGFAAGPDTTRLNTPVSDSIIEETVSDSTVKIVDSVNIIKKITLSVKTEPVGAAVILDDSVRGLSPIYINDVDTGTHLIALKKKGFYLKKEQFHVGISDTLELNYVMLQPAHIVISTEPAAAQLFLNKKPVGLSPYNNLTVKPGEYVVSAEMQNFETLEQTFVVKSGASDTLHLSLKHSKTYVDSVNNAQILMKRKQKRFSAGLVAGVFGAFCLVLLVMESRSK
jgi:hypothetical protein